MACLLWCYTGDVPLTGETCVAVLEAARYYAWDGAAARCEALLARGLSVENAADVLRVADELGAAALGRAAAQFCLSHFNEAGYGFLRPFTDFFAALSLSSFWGERRLLCATLPCCRKVT